MSGPGATTSISSSMSSTMNVEVPAPMYQYDMETLSQAMNRLQAAGFTGNWIALPGGRFRSVDGGTEFDAAEVEVHYIVRFEGVSDPDDESILYAMVGPHDRGLFATAFGPNIAAEEVDVLRRLPSTSSAVTSRSRPATPNT
ncbi:MAG: hypothetical protein ACR2QK_18250 [Acidimicrobiales bacterium]